MFIRILIAMILIFRKYTKLVTTYGVKGVPINSELCYILAPCTYYTQRHSYQTQSERSQLFESNPNG